MQMLFGVGLRSLLTSRWLALLWAILVLLTAINLVGPQGPANDATPDGQAASNDSDPIGRINGARP